MNKVPVRNLEGADCLKVCVFLCPLLLQLPTLKKPVDRDFLAQFNKMSWYVYCKIFVKIHVLVIPFLFNKLLLRTREFPIIRKVKTDRVVMDSVHDKLFS